jgi:ABC-type polysaccharide/polyol phosphate export permease
LPCDPRRTYTARAARLLSEGYSLGTIVDGFADLAAAWKRRQLAIFLAWSETVARYRRSTLGPLWLVLGTAVGVGGLGFVWSILLNQDIATFVPSLTVGLVIWQFVSGVITDAAGMFPRNATMLVNIKMPVYLITLQAFGRHLINFAHNLVVVLIVFLIFPHFNSWISLLALPGLLLVCINLVALMQLVGIIGARYRDLEPLIASFFPILFFLSPVLYRPGQLGAAQAVMVFNPISHYIMVIRDPLLGSIPSLESYAVVLALTAVIVVASLWLTGRRAYRLPYWM